MSIDAKETECGNSICVYEHMYVCVSTDQSIDWSTYRFKILHNLTGFISRGQDLFNIRKSNNIIHHMNRIKEKNHLII